MTAEHRPSLSLSQAASIAADLFDLRATATQLVSDRDQNFKLIADDGSTFVLKVASADVPLSRLEFENKLLRAAASRNLPMETPVPLASRSGEEVGQVESGDAQYLVRLLSWVDGIPLAHVRPHTNELLVSIGTGLGRLSKILADINGPDHCGAPQWSLEQAEAAIVEGREVMEDSKRGLVERQHARFKDATKSSLDRLPTQTVHNDANDHNILASLRDDGYPSFAGLIDFGDARTSWRIADLAIACAYIMFDKPDPLEAAEALARGFHSATKLSEAEVAVLFNLICTRLCQSVSISTRRAAEEPDNAYFQVSARPAWDLLELLESVNPRLAHFRLRSACGFEANPESTRIRDWLGENGRSFAQVCDLDLRKNQLQVLDLTPGSLDPVLMAGEERATRVLFERMSAADGPAAVVGRYDEPRAIYSGPQFQLRTSRGSEFRTIHLGIDIFRPAGTPIFAPIDGQVSNAVSTPEEQGYGVVIVIKHEPEDCPPFFTLYGHLSASDLDSLNVGDRLNAGDQLGTIGRASENGGWPPHLHFQIITDMLDLDDGFPGVAYAGRRDLWRSLSPDPNLILQIEPGLLRTEQPDSPEEIGRRRARVLGPSLSLSYDKPLNIVRGVGTYLIDQLGRRYLDCVNNVCHVGHGHPAVVEAASAQMRVLNTNTRYLHENIVRYAERLTATLPDHLDTCFLVNSGSEANDLAIRLAESATGKTGAIVFEGAYHGHLSSLVRLSPYKFDGPGGKGRASNVFVAPMPDPYRGRHRGELAVDGYSTDFTNTLEEMIDAGVGSAFLFESILSCGGQVDPPAGFLAEACDRARSAGLVNIADEVQIGFGRVGETFWGFERDGLSPDVVTMGKSIGNGHPLAAVVTTREIAESFADGMEYFNTFGGNPVSCAVGLAVLDVIEREELQQNARSIGSMIKKGLTDLAAEHRVIGDVRGVGLFLGIELVADRESREPVPKLARYLVNRAAELGVLLSTDGPERNVIKIKPPMVFGESDVAWLTGTLDFILAETAFRT